MDVRAVTDRFPRTISDTVIGPHPIFRARSRIVSPMGMRNSSRKMSPGVFAAGPSGILIFVFILVVVGDFYSLWPLMSPAEADPPLLVDTDRVLPSAVPAQSF